MTYPVMAPDDLTQRQRAKWIVRTGWNGSQPNHPLGEYAYNTLKFKKIAVIGLDYAFGWEVIGGFQRTFEENGGKIVQKIWCPLTAQRFQSLSFPDFEGRRCRLWPSLPAVHASVYQAVPGIRSQRQDPRDCSRTDHGRITSCPQMGDEADRVITGPSITASHR